MKKQRGLSAVLCFMLLLSGLSVRAFASDGTDGAETAQKIAEEGRSSGIILDNRYFPGEGKSEDELLEDLRGFVDGSGTLKNENAQSRGWGVVPDPRPGSLDQDGKPNYVTKIFTTMESSYQGGLKYKFSSSGNYGAVPSMFVFSYRIYPVKLAEVILSIGESQNTVCLMGTNSDGIQVKDTSGKVIYKTGTSGNFQFNEWNDLTFIVNDKEKTFRMMVNGELASYVADGVTAYDLPYRNASNSANMLSFLATAGKENEFYIDDVYAAAVAPFVACENNENIVVHQDVRTIVYQAGVTVSDLYNLLETRPLIDSVNNQTTYAWSVYNAAGQRVEDGTIGDGYFVAAFPSDASDTTIWYDLQPEVVTPTVYRWYDFDEFTYQSSQLTNPFKYQNNADTGNYMYATSGETGFTFWANNAQVTETKAPDASVIFDVESGVGDKINTNNALIMHSENQKTNAEYINFYPYRTSSRGAADYSQFVIDMDYCYTGDSTQQYFQFFTSYSTDGGASWKDYYNNFARMSLNKFGYASGDSDSKVIPFEDESGEMQFEKGKWYNLKAVINNTDNNLTFYINGEKKYSGVLVPEEKLGTGILGSTYRIKIAAAYENSGTGTGTFALDNIKTYSYPGLLPDTYLYSASENVIVNNLQEIIAVQEGTTVEALAEALGGNIEIERNRCSLVSGVVADGDTVYTTNGTFTAKYDTVVIPSGSKGKFLRTDDVSYMNREQYDINLQFIAGEDIPDSTIYIAGFDGENRLQEVVQVRGELKKGEITSTVLGSNSFNPDLHYTAYSWSADKLEPLASTMSVDSSVTPDIYIAGDSLACRYSRDNTRQGYGDYLAERLSPVVTVHNYALGGSSSATFRASWRWQNIINSLKKGDVVIISTLHNDQVGANAVETAIYKQNLELQYQDVVDRGGRVIFCTGSTVATEEYSTFHDAYYEVLKTVSEEKDCVLIDLYTPMIQLINTEGLETVREKYYEPGDTTHFNRAGADLLASWFQSQLEEKKDPLSNYLK